MAYFVVQRMSLCAESYITTLYQMSEFKADHSSFFSGRQKENWQLMPQQAELLFVLIHLIVTASTCWF